jgi:hypothetical protein
VGSSRICSAAITSGSGKLNKNVPPPAEVLKYFQEPPCKKNGVLDIAITNHEHDILDNDETAAYGIVGLRGFSSFGSLNWIQVGFPHILSCICCSLATCESVNGFSFNSAG